MNNPFNKPKPELPDEGKRASQFNRNRVVPITSRTPKRKAGTGCLMVGPGRYFLGDPCYAIPQHEDWLRWLENADSRQLEKKVLDGTLPGGSRVLAFRVGDDGLYRGTDGMDYCVDSGLIGLVPTGAVEYTDPQPNLGRILTLPNPTECLAENGSVRIGDIRISRFHLTVCDEIWGG